MPYGDWFDDYYSSIFVAAIESAGLEPRRADDLFRSSTIVNDNWEYTKSAKLILADLTDKNPNVFYELGLAHAMAKPAILVTASLDDVPFDLRGLRIIEYDKNVPDWGSVLQESLKSAILETVESPLKTVLPTFVEAAAQEPGTKMSKQDRVLANLQQDVDMLRRQLRRGPSSRARGEGAVPSSEEGAISPGDARRLIMRMLASGAPEDGIVDVVSSLGAPSRWIAGQIRSVREDTSA
jgi:hypothetical protein